MILVLYRKDRLIIIKVFKVIERIIEVVIFKIILWLIMIEWLCLENSML